MQEIIEAFGFEWRMVSRPLLDTYCSAHFLAFQAPGEAEAELAYLNRIGVIDAIITDDVDTFLFGATMLIRKFVANHASSQREFEHFDLVQVKCYLGIRPTQ